MPHNDASEIYVTAPERRMGGAPFGPFKHQVLAIARAIPRSFPKSLHDRCGHPGRMKC